MANEIQHADITGLTFYTIVLSPTGTAWDQNSSSFEAPQTSHWSQYAIALAEQNGTGLYAGAFPGAIVTPATYGILVYQQGGGSPASTDLLVAQDSIAWNGTAEMVPLDGATAVPATGNAANSLFDCLNAARAQGFGKWAILGNTLTLYAPDGSTPVRVFNLDQAAAPTQRS